MPERGVQLSVLAGGEAEQGSITVVGILGDSLDSLGPEARLALREAGAVAGGRRHLEAFRLWAATQSGPGGTDGGVGGCSGTRPGSRTGASAGASGSTGSAFNPGSGFGGAGGPGLPGRGGSLRALPTIEMGNDADAFAHQIAQRAVEQDQRVCVLASGDPGFFGVLRALLRVADRSTITVLPSPSSVSTAFARLGLPWDDAVVVSVHGRPLDEAVGVLRLARKAAVLTSPQSPPQAVARAVLSAGLSMDLVALCSRLGYVDEVVAEMPLEELARGTWDPLSVVVLVGPGGLQSLGWDGGPDVAGVVGRAGGAGPADIAGPTSPAGGTGPAGVTGLAGAAGGPDSTDGLDDGSEPSAEDGFGWLPGSGAKPRIMAWGLPDHLFAHRGGMVTKAEVRAVALGKLELPPAGVLWDVGAGSGSVAVECSRLCPGLTVFAIEPGPEDAARIASNAVTLGASVHVVPGAAPEALDALPDPDRVFVGGGGVDVLDAVLARLRPRGRVVATYAALDRAGAAADRLGAVVEVSTSRGRRLPDGGWRLHAQNPVFVAWGPVAPDPTDDADAPPAVGSPPDRA